MNLKTHKTGVLNVQRFKMTIINNNFITKLIWYILCSKKRQVCSNNINIFINSSYISSMIYAIVVYD